MIGREKITKANSHHDGSAPVNSVQVLNPPSLCINAAFGEPVVAWFQVGHPQQDTAKNMG